MNAPALSTEARPVLDIAVMRGADGQSRLVRHRVSYPWSLGRGYPSVVRSGTITIIPQAAGAGLLPGDCFRQQVAVAPGASLRVAPAGATLVHGVSPSRPGISSWRHVLEEAAMASIAPEPYVLMEDADLVLRQDLVVGANAVLVATDAIVLAPGVSRACWRMETSASRPDGTRIFDDVQVATAPSLCRTGGLPGSFSAFATMLVLAPAASVKGLEHELGRRIGRAGSVLWGACAPLRAGAGLGVRLAAREGGRIRDAARALHEFAEASVGT